MYNNALLNFVLDDLMPWQTTTYDFSLLEVINQMFCSATHSIIVTHFNQSTFLYQFGPLHNIQGFTQEITVALLTNIESAEWERRAQLMLLRLGNLLL